MSGYLNLWHYFVIFVFVVILIGGVVFAFMQPNKKIKWPIVFSVSAATLLFGFVFLLIVDKYTKIVTLYKVENQRLLNIEKIVYTGIVRNDGKFSVGEVVFEIKLVNKGHGVRNLEPGTFFQVRNLFDFLGIGDGGADILYKPQTIKKRFVVATNLQPNATERFRVMFDYPSYFANTAQFYSVEAH
ncbi:MAG: DUF2393 family protein [Sulfurimonadaceae bacterium]|jgi:hypothetical protein|nr:DUF2393 family protein [Sulfurimonadaceae bacterium]